jgi:predicted RNase H-like HicB family nuclease
MLEFCEKILVSALIKNRVGSTLKYAIIVEKDEDNIYIASVPELPGCHTQAKTLDQLTERVKEAIIAYLEAEGTKSKEHVELVGFQFVEVTT